MDIHKAKVTKQAQLIKDSSNNVDADLTTQVEELQEILQKLKEEYVTLDKAYKTDVTKLDILITRHSILVSKTTLWEATAKEIKSTL